MRTLACLVLAAFAAAAAAAPFAVQVGQARIALDAPPGFADTAFTGSPRLQELAESLTSASNRILLFALTDGDVRRFTVGDTPEYRRYVLAATPKAAQHEWLSARAFQAFVSEVLGTLGAPAPAGTDVARHLDTRAAGTPALIAELRRDPSLVTVLQGVRLATGDGAEAKSHYLLFTTSFVVLRGKPLSLAVYTRYEAPADVEWLKATTASWIEELQRLNRP